MKKVIVVLILLIIPITYSYAIEREFFEVSKLEVSKSEKIEMIINFERIKYDKFLFELKSSENIENIELSDETLGAEKCSNEISFEIDKKSTNLKTINLYYQIPQTLQANDIIRFTATVTNMENNDEDVGNEVQTVQVEVKVVEKKEEQIENNKENQEHLSENKPEVEEKQTENKEIVVNNKTQVTSVSQKNNKTSEETVIYNGADNNYLSELFVSGYELNKAFSKDNSTYFITIEDDVNSLDITTSTEDDSAIVCVYGNESLNKGTNKILISVTAENGNVRNYRIYVIKKS